VTTYVVRHAPTVYSAAYRVNGVPSVDVPLTSDGEAACVQARSVLPIDEIAACVASPFRRCQRTADLLVDSTAPILTDARLGELDYGAFEGGEFLAYARWLAQHGPSVRPPGGRESQSVGIIRMLTGLRAVLDRPKPRLVVAHGLLLSVVRWARAHPGQPLIDVFLPGEPSLTPMVVADDELTAIIGFLVDDLDHAVRGQRRWRVDLAVFPREARTALATVSAYASLRTGVSENPTKRRSHA
jgi:2,3-bisphosphoglycerate-dependent phosphoglycerate mutase